MALRLLTNDSPIVYVPVEGLALVLPVPEHQVDAVHRLHGLVAGGGAGGRGGRGEVAGQHGAVSRHAHHIARVQSWQQRGLTVVTRVRGDEEDSFLIKSGPHPVQNIIFFSQWILDLHLVNSQYFAVFHAPA